MRPAEGVPDVDKLLRKKEDTSKGSCWVEEEKR